MDGEASVGGVPVLKVVLMKNVCSILSPLFKRYCLGVLSLISVARYLAYETARTLAHTPLEFPSLFVYNITMVTSNHNYYYFAFHTERASG